MRLLDLLSNEIKLGDAVAFGTSSCQAGTSIGIVTKFNPKTIRVGEYRTIQPVNCVVITQQLEETDAIHLANLRKGVEDCMDDTKPDLKVKKTYKAHISSRQVLNSANTHWVHTGQCRLLVRVFFDGVQQGEIEASQLDISGKVYTTATNVLRHSEPFGFGSKSTGKLTTGYGRKESVKTLSGKLVKILTQGELPLTSRTYEFDSLQALIDHCGDDFMRDSSTIFK